MNVLVVSFDKSLINQLREVLKEQNLIDARNGEEAINTAPPFVDVVIYDAIAGSISEEDINNMYRQKFRDAKYIVLVDDIFPVDMNNIAPSNKVRLLRDEAPSKIKDVLSGSSVETFTSFQEKPLQEISQTQEESISPEKFFFETEITESFPPILETQEEVIPKGFEPKPLMGKKLLIVSFDGNLITKLKGAMPKEAEIIQVSNMKEVADKAKEADVIIFDTILGMLARKTLVDMSREDQLREKPYILLIDELFTIDVDDIPLNNKYKFARESELSKAVEKALELIRKSQPTTYAPPLEFVEERSLEEAPLTQEESSDVMGLLERIISAGSAEVKEESAVPLEQEEKRTAKRAEYAPQPVELGNLVESLTSTLQEAVKSQLSQKNLYLILSQVIKQEDIKEQVANTIRGMVESILREEVKSVLAEINISEIIREVAYNVLKERIRELIT